MEATRLLAIAEGLLVGAIWASSPVIVKMGLAHMGPLTLAGMRYFAAFLVLLRLMARRGGLKSNPPPGHWTRLFLMGFCAYTPKRQKARKVLISCRDYPAAGFAMLAEIRPPWGEPGAGLKLL